MSFKISSLGVLSILLNLLRFPSLQLLKNQIMHVLISEISGCDYSQHKYSILPINYVLSQGKTSRERLNKVIPNNPWVCSESLSLFNVYSPRKSWCRGCFFHTWCKTTTNETPLPIESTRFFFLLIIKVKLRKKEKHDLEHCVYQS